MGDGVFLGVAVTWVLRVESCTRLCCGFSGLNPASGCAVDF